MHVRILALLLASIMTLGAALGAAAPAGTASSDAVSQLDAGAPDVEPALAELPAELWVPGRSPVSHSFAPVAAPAGRRHGVWVFRPPRAVAGR